MIPIKLTIQGLYSYQEKQTIDFQRLTEARLFGIFGSVGSGKSSILDAITYALYGETERMNARDNRNYNMMNLKSDELFIEFDFICGNGSTTYRSVVRGRRNKKRFDEVKTLDRLAYKSNEGVWEPVPVEDLNQIIGLSYENFKRTIIIPQGKFQEFLQLGNKDRTQMMKELFNLEKFELYYKTVALETKNTERLQMLRGQLQQLGEVEPGQLTEFQNRLALIRDEIKLLSGRILIKQQEEKVLSHLKQLDEKLNAQQFQFDGLTRKEQEFQKSEQHLKEYEYCLTNFKNLFDQADEISKRIGNLNHTIAIETVQLEGSLARLSGLEGAFDKLKTAYEQRETLKQQSVELSKIVRIIELNLDNLRFGERIKNGEKVCEGSKIKIDELRNTQLRLSEELKTLKSQLPDLAILAQVQQWFTIRKSLAEGELGNKNELNLLEREMDTLKTAIDTSTGLYLEDLPTITGIPASLNFLAAKVQNLKKSISEKSQKTEHLLIQEKLEEFATNLEEGQPCPLCGSLEHPEKLDASDVKTALTITRTEKLYLENEVESVERVATTLREMEMKLRLKEESVQKVSLKLLDIQKNIDAHQTLFAWPGFEVEEVLNARFKEAKITGEAIKSKEALLDKCRVDLENEQKHLENYLSTLDKIRESFTVNQSEVNTLVRQVVLLDPELYLSQTPEQVKQLSDQLLATYVATGEAYLKISAEITSLQKKRDESSGKLHANQSIFAKEYGAQIALNEAIQQALQKSGFETFGQISEVLKSTIDAEAERKKILDFRQQLQFVVQQITLLKKEIGDKAYLSEEHAKLNAELTDLAGSLAAQNRELGKTEGEIRKLSEDLVRQSELRKSVEILDLRAEDLKTMKQLFKGSGFVNYVSSVHLQNLCLAANDRFYKLVRQKMSLEINDDNSFQVRDFLNGGKVRSVKTLSGGQTFQAALSLALALADSIHRFTESSQNFFFLDEGFGSLDKESLEVVFETLKSLRKENRIVGVISHVEEMQQEIDRHLRIVNNDETGSLVVGSWEN